MGQDVVVRGVVAFGDVIVVDLDRSLTGQDGEAATPGAAGDGVPGALAERLFALAIGIDHVFVQQNAVTVRRSGGWDSQSQNLVVGVASSFLRFYDEEE